MIEQLLTHEAKLNEGDVALVFTKAGDLVIRHNIAAVRETGEIRGGDTATGFLLAIACAIMMGNEQMSMPLVSEAASRLEELTFAEVPRTHQ